MIRTARLLLRRPRAEDAEVIFARYASDPEVTRHLSWPTHRTADDTRAFLAFADAEWAKHGTGAMLVELADGTLVGSTGIHPSTPGEAMTGYVFARDAWGRGYASEALAAVVTRAGELSLDALTAYVHDANVASQRVLEKCGFTRTSARPEHVFPNLDGAPRVAVSTYRISLRQR